MSDSAEIVKIALLYAGVGVLYIGLGIPLLLGRVRPNSWYGSRTRKTRSSNRVWYAVNRITGRDLVITGVSMIGAATLVFAFRGSMTPSVAAALPLVVLILGVMTMVLNSLRAEKRM